PSRRSHSMPLVTANPATGEQIATYDEMSPEEISQIVDRAHEAWLDWKTTTFDERATLVRRLASVLREDNERLAALMTQEMGKPNPTSRRSPRTPTPARATSPSGRSGSFSRSCRGTSPSGRCSASPRPP